METDFLKANSVSAYLCLDQYMKTSYKEGTSSFMKENNKKYRIHSGKNKIGCWNQIYNVMIHAICTILAINTVILEHTSYRKAKVF